MRRKRHWHLNIKTNNIEKGSTNLEKEIETCKTVYKNKIEQLFNSNKSSDAWKGLSFMSGYKSKSCMLAADDTLAFANELNEFYNRFDTLDE